MSSFSSLLNRIRRRMLGSPRRTRTQSTSLEAKPRRRYVFVHICPYWMYFILCGCWINVKARGFPVFKTTCLFLSRSGPREKWGISSTTWSSSTRRPTTSCTKKFPTTSSSPPLLCLRGWRSVALWQGTPSRSCSPKVNFTFSAQSSWRSVLDLWR